MKMTLDVLSDLLDERRRQIQVEGYTSSIDDANANGELAQAAACYLCYYGNCMQCRNGGTDCPVDMAFFKEFWPSQFLPTMFKPDGKRSDLIKAAALIVAEIERLDRMENENANSL